MMKQILRRLLVIPFLACAATLQAQQAAPDPTSAAKIRIFIDCQTRCDNDYLRTEIDFAEHMRERRDADVHILVTSQNTGAGGQEHAILFTGLGGYDGLTDELRFTTPPNTAQDLIRERMARLISGGLVRYAARTSLYDAITLDYDGGDEDDDDGGPAAADPWNNWVFRVSVNGNGSGESAYTYRNVNFSLSANRVTAGWRTNLSTNARNSVNETDVGDRTVENTQTDRSVNSNVVRSISDHWSVGTRTNLNQSTFLNQDLSVRVAPAIEFNVFPYSESTRRALTFQYSLGANRVDYDQETIYSRFTETLMDQQLRVGYEMRQRWGNLEMNLAGSHYLHDLSKYQLNAFGDLELRLFRGFGVNFNGNFARIHDQLFLPKGSLTPEQILIRQQQIATSFRYFFNFGVSYSFGSIYNSVVNPRMN